MIGFRYHLVSTAAVLFALAVGIVLGTSTLSGPILDGLNQSSASLSRSNQQLSDRLSSVASTAASEDQFIARIAPLAAAGRLAGHSVALVCAPGVSPAAGPALIALLRDAGASVVADIRLAPGWLSARQEPLRSSLADRLAGHVLAAGAAGDAAATELAAVLTTRPGAPAATGAALPEVLSAFGQAGLLSVVGQVSSSASVALVLVPAQVPGGPGGSAARELLDLAVALRARTSATALAGPTGVGSGRGTLAGRAGLRGVPAVVSGDDTTAGRLQAVLSLAQQLGS